jgi:hypothetical protein
MEDSVVKSVDILLKDNLISNSAIFQLYHGESKLIFIETMMRSKVLDQHAELDFYSASSLKQQSADRHVKAIIIVKYMEDSVVKSVDILLKDNLIRNLKKKLHQNQTKNKR